MSRTSVFVAGDDVTDEENSTMDISLDKMLTHIDFDPHTE